MYYNLLTIYLQAEACRAVATAIKKCPNGMYAEIKYDGERVQVHKQGNKFEYFSRSLKPVQSHKVHTCTCTHVYVQPHDQGQCTSVVVISCSIDVSFVIAVGGAHQRLPP